MKKITLALVMLIASSSLLSQTYSTTGGILPVDPLAPNAGGDFYNLTVPDDFTIENLQIRIVADVLEHGGDTVSVLDNLGIEVWHNGQEMSLYDHTCTYDTFTEVDWTFSDDAAEYVNETCTPSGTYKTANMNRFGETLTTDLSLYDGQNAGGLWQFFIIWKPYAMGGGPDNPLSVDSLILIFEGGGTVSIDEEEASNNLKIYPNPIQSNNIVQIENGTNEKFDLMIYDMNGRVVIAQQNNIGKVAVSLDNIERGTYLLEVMNANGTREQELLVVN